jgi:hypothetical protein
MDTIKKYIDAIHAEKEIMDFIKEKCDSKFNVWQTSNSIAFSTILQNKYELRFDSSGSEKDFIKGLKAYLNSKSK